MEKTLKNILLVITKGELGGAQVFLLNLARCLKESGQTVTVAYGEDGYLPIKLEEEGIESVKIKNLRRSANPFSGVKYIFELKKYIENKDFNVVHFNSTNALLGAMSVKLLDKKLKTIFTFHGLSLLDSGYKKNIILKIANYILFKFLLIFVDEKVFVSGLNQKRAQDIKLVQDGKTIYNGINTSEEDFLVKEDARDYLEERYNIYLEDKFIIGTVGRLDYQKNHAFLLNNFEEIEKIIPNLAMVIIGEGNERGSLEKIIEKKNIGEKVFLLGELNDAVKYIRAFDVYALPSRYEGLSISLIEALFSGVPILASDVGGNKEVISNINNLFLAGDKEDFIKKLKIISDYSLNKAIEKEKFTSNKMTESYLEIYKN
ncbi:MAG: glycosyltransferase [Patescibacteria group bacterium]|jgi:glycosyltransferase involved in cell wall biosynthesis|nr:glycosyltransferase [Patescibacteria group bacterium]